MSDGSQRWCWGLHSSKPIVRVVHELPVIDFLPDGVLITNAQSVIIEANEVVCKMFGYERSSMIGQSVHVLVPAHIRSEHVAMAESVITSMKITAMAARRRVQGQRRDGETFDVSIHLSPLYLAVGQELQTIVTCVIRDVSDYNAALCAQTAAEVHRRLLEDFLRTINHQVRTSLHAVTNSLTLLENELKGDADDAHSGAMSKVLTLPSFQGVSSNISSMERLLTNLVDLRNLQEHNMSTQITRVDVPSALRSIIDSVRDKAKERNQIIDLRVDETVQMILLDNVLLCKSVQSLLDNAMQFSPDNSRILITVKSSNTNEANGDTSPTILVRSQSPIDDLNESRVHLTIAVCDNGFGISPEALRNMESGLHHSDQGTTRMSDSGIGMGLAIAKYCAEGLGATLYVQSGTVDGWKTVFTLRFAAPIALSTPPSTPTLLPAIEERASSGPQPIILRNVDVVTRNRTDEGGSLLFSHPDTCREQIVQHFLSPPMRSRRDRLNILLVEDNVINVKVIRQCLRSKGITHVTVCTNGEQAVHLFDPNSTTYRPTSADPFHIILMDCEMPVMDGFMATSMLRMLGVKLPIIALTANSTLQAQDKCRQSGMDLFLTKPIKTETLIFAFAAFPPFEFYHPQRSPYHLTPNLSYTLSAGCPSPNGSGLEYSPR